MPEPVPLFLLLLFLAFVIFFSSLCIFHRAESIRATRRLRHLKLLSSRDPIVDFGISRTASSALSSLSARALSSATRRGTLRAETLVRAACLRARFAGDQFRAVADECFLDALVNAAALDATPLARRLAPLFGIPVTISDAVNVRGLDTAPNIRSPSKKDAEVVCTLRAAGAVVICKSNQVSPPASPYGGGDSLFGVVGNPWQKGLAAGGSSSGAAVLAAVRAGWLHVGTDAGGLMRSAAAACGVCDFAPTGGFGGRGAMAGEREALLRCDPGILARSIDDILLACEALGIGRVGTSDKLLDHRVGRVGQESWSSAQLSVGVVRSDNFFGTPHPAIARGLEHSASLLAEKGYRVVDFRLPFDPEGMDIVPLVAALLTRNEWDIVMADAQDGDEVSERHGDGGRVGEREKHLDGSSAAVERGLKRGFGATSIVTNSDGESEGDERVLSMAGNELQSDDEAENEWREGQRIREPRSDTERDNGVHRQLRSSALGAIIPSISFLGSLHPGARRGLAWLAGSVLRLRRTATLLKGVNQGLARDHADELLTRRAELAEKLRHAMGEAGVDAVIMPPAAIPAGVARSRYRNSLLPAFVYSALATVLGFPSGGCPVSRVQPGETKWHIAPVDGYDRRARQATKGSIGCPVSCSVFAAPGHDLLCLRVLRDLSDAAGFECHPPQMEDFLTSWPGPQPGAARPDERTPLLSEESQDWTQELASQLVHSVRKAFGANRSSWVGGDGNVFV